MIERGSEMAKAYDHTKVEAPLYQMWMDRGYFRPKVDPDAPKERRFCIIMPPPNVTGELHLGHALTATIEDALIRWHRMLGDPTLWIPGVDHAGIATQNVVEKELAKEGVSRHDLGRDEFEKRVWTWVGQIRSRISRQHMRLGASCDWDREVFTLDDGPQLAVRTTFKRMYDEGLIYKGERITNWCPRCQTALSDLEVDHEDIEGNLWYVRYPLLDSAGNMTDDYILCATTRPETIVADTGIAVNPALERWREALGRSAVVPVIERLIPVVADEAVEAEFGTGAIKVTPGHDPVDFEIGGRHGLPVIVAMDAEAKMNEHAGPYAGLDRFETRERIVADMQSLGLIEKVEPHRHSVGHCSRCNTIVEPVASEQWFVNVKPLAEVAINVVKRGEIEIVPERFEKVYYNWMENIRDWCISRQLWWGHRIPVWYCKACGEKFAAIEDPAKCETCGDAGIEQDPDVLDTWFSSGLWPHSTLGWPEETEDLKYWYPTSVLETGYDILFFWVARMIMLGLYNMREVPFRHVYLHGLIRDAQGRKMTKSVGNVVDPLVASDRYGTDALRFTLATGGAPGNDFRLFDEKLEASRNFANKIWNASRFVISSIGQDKIDVPDEFKLRDLYERANWPLEDRWIYSRYLEAAREVNRYLGEFQVNEAGRVLYEFFWNEYCDWYVEMAKVRLRDGDQSPLPVLATVLQGSLRLLHPFIPFVTEAIWQHMRDVVDLEREALIAASYPLGEGERDTEAEEVVERLQRVVRELRDIKDRVLMMAGAKVPEMIIDLSPSAHGVHTIDWDSLLAEHGRTLRRLAGIESLRIVRDSSGLDRSTLAGFIQALGVNVYAPRSAAEQAAELTRLRRQLEDAEAIIAQERRRLGDDSFLNKAPPEIVSQARSRLAEALMNRDSLNERLSYLASD